MAQTNHPDSFPGQNTADPASELTVESLLRRHGSALLGICLANTRSIHDAEDVMQNVFVKALGKFNTLRDSNRARPWLLQIARRECIDHHRKRRLTQQIQDDVPSQSKSNDQRLEQLHTAISKLPEDYREAISLYYLDGRKCLNVAQSLDITEQAVRQRLVRARLMLHDLLVEDQS